MMDRNRAASHHMMGYMHGTGLDRELAHVDNQIRLEQGKLSTDSQYQTLLKDRTQQRQLLAKANRAYSTQLSATKELRQHNDLLNKKQTLLQQERNLSKKRANHLNNWVDAKKEDVKKSS